VHVPVIEIYPDRTTGLSEWSGTSFATPIVTACCAVIKKVLVTKGLPSAPRDTVRRLIAGCVKLPDVEYKYQGSGIVNLGRSLETNEDGSWVYDTVPLKIRVYETNMTSSGVTVSVIPYLSCGQIDNLTVTLLDSDSNVIAVRENVSLDPVDPTDIEIVLPGYTAIQSPFQIRFAGDNADEAVTVESALVRTHIEETVFGTSEFGIAEGAWVRKTFEDSAGVSADCWQFAQPASNNITVSESENTLTLEKVYVPDTDGPVFVEMDFIANMRNALQPISSELQGLDSIVHYYNITQRLLMWKENSVDKWWYCGNDAGLYTLGAGEYLKKIVQYLDTEPFLAFGDFTVSAHWEVENSDTAQGWDSWNIRVSSDGGATWDLLTPENRPYDHLTSYATTTTEGLPVDSPLQPCYGKASDGWEDLTCNLSSYLGQNVVVRIAFASDFRVTAPGVYVRDMAHSGTELAVVPVHGVAIINRGVRWGDYFQICSPHQGTFYATGSRRKNGTANQDVSHASKVVAYQPFDTADLLSEIVGVNNMTPQSVHAVSATIIDISHAVHDIKNDPVPFVSGV